MAVFVEHDNRKIAKAHAEYITGKALRQYLADKVKQYVGENSSIFDGTAGSGQLVEFIHPSDFLAVEIQPKSCQALKQNYPNAKVYCQSFFEFDTDKQMDCVVMNPPFSMKFKDLSDGEQTNIQNEFAFKKSGVVDDIFVLKAMKYAKRFGFFILFLGVGYRNTEKTFRQLIGKQIVELNVIQNAFDDTSIDVMVLILDKQKTSQDCHRERYDCKTKTVINQDTWQIDGEHWQAITPPTPPKETIDPIALELQARQQLKNTVMANLTFSKLVADFEPVLKCSFNHFCDDLCQSIKKYTQP